MSLRSSTTADRLGTAPFLRWPGGKRWLVKYIRDLIVGIPVRRYYEPFLGGGALFFALRPRSAHLSDVNGELINTYEQVRDHHSQIMRRLQRMPVTRDIFYDVRQRRPSSRIDRAVNFLYLNRTAYAGIYRVNRAGVFNVPYGGGDRTPRILHESDLLERASLALHNTHLRVADFESVLQRPKFGDLVYCDPTYTVAHDNNGFVRYNERNFSWRDQLRLADAARAASRRGALVLVSNAHHPEVAKLYEDAELHVLGRSSLLAKKRAHRRYVLEYLFIFRPR